MLHSTDVYTYIHTYIHTYILSVKVYIKYYYTIYYALQYHSIGIVVLIKSTYQASSRNSSIKIANTLQTQASICNALFNRIKR